MNQKYYFKSKGGLNFLCIADVLVDGPFKKQYADTTYHWAGSTNQRVIDVQESLKYGRVIQHK